MLNVCEVESIKDNDARRKTQQWRILARNRKNIFKENREIETRKLNIRIIVYFIFYILI